MRCIIMKKYGYQCVQNICNGILIQMLENIPSKFSYKVAGKKFLLKLDWHLVDSGPVYSCLSLIQNNCVHQ